jgi:hypothetical protein
VYVCIRIKYQSCIKFPNLESRQGQIPRIHTRCCKWPPKPEFCGTILCTQDQYITAFVIDTSIPRKYVSESLCWSIIC